MAEVPLLTILILAAAILYSSVGHAGASGYLAAMALVGIEPDAMKPTALLLNILVASIGTIRFWRAGCFSWRVFLPFAVGSIPFAFLGGALTLPGTLYKQVLGLILLVASYRLFFPRKKTDGPAAGGRPAFWVAVLCGAGIGLLSGLTGTGGGIFLTPLLLFAGWAETRESAGVSVAFVLVNSVAAIAGHLPRMDALPPAIPYYAVAAVAGGITGSELGARRLGSETLQRLLGLVLVVAAVKLILT